MQLVHLNFLVAELERIIVFRGGFRKFVPYLMSQG